MHKMPFDNTIDEKTGLDGHAFLCMAIDEVQFLIHQRIVGGRKEAAA